MDGKDVANTSESLWQNRGANFEEWENINDIDTVLSRACLDYDVQKTPVLGSPDSGMGSTDLMEVSDHYVTYRMDTEQPLGVVGSKYSILQNETAFEMLDTIREQAFKNDQIEGTVDYESAGFFGNGEVSWVLMNLPYTLPVKGRDVQARCLFKNSFDGSAPFSAKFFAEDQICSNGMTAITTQGTVTIRHTQSIEGRLESARMVISKAIESFGGMRETILDWLDTPFDYQRMCELGNRLFPKNEDGERSTRAENNREALIDCYEDPIGPTAGFEGTAYQAYNAITEYVRHEKGIRPGDKDEKQARLESVYEGTGSDFERKGVNHLEKVIA